MKTKTTITSLIICSAIWCSGAFAACVAPQCNKIVNNGPDAQKKIMVVIGDGYDSDDQSKYNQDVKDIMIDGVFGHDFYLENQNAFNIYRINLVSNDSGVSQKVYDENGTPSDGSDDTVVSLDLKDTALKYIFSGSWAHCWLESSATTSALVNATLAANVPNYDYVAIILNEDSSGGCGGGGFQIVPRGVSWPIMAHEFGHGVGGLRDEYSRSGTTYTGGTVNNRNCSTETDRDDVFWSRFIHPGTPVPTTFNAASGMDSNKTAGIYEGCSTKAEGIFRPVHNCRMRGNTPEFGPVCYTLMKDSLFGNLQHNFKNSITGDFTGDGLADVVIHNKQDLSLFEKSSAKHELNWKWVANNIVPAANGGITWQPAAHDQYFVADFNGDEKDDLFVFNGQDWSKPYLGLLRSTGAGFEGIARYDTSIPGIWQMKSKDQLFVSDFNGDGKDDLLIRNGSQWSFPYVAMLRSTGTSLSGTKRFDGNFPGWQMRANDQLFVADFNGNGSDDVYIFNGDDWGPEYLGMLSSSGNNLSNVKLYSDSLPGWSMTNGDELLVGDINGDNKEDLYIFNSDNWSYAYLLMARSTGNSLAFSKRYDNGSAAANIPGWSMQKGDSFWISDANKDGRDDLFVFNPAINWGTEYLGTLMSSGNALSGSWSANWVGGWNLGSVDKIMVSNYEGGAGAADIYIHNDNWFGLLRRNNSGFTMDRIYQSWIYSALYDKKPWANTLP